MHHPSHYNLHTASIDMTSMHSHSNQLEADPQFGNHPQEMFIGETTDEFRRFLLDVYGQYILEPHQSTEPMTQSLEERLKPRPIDPSGLTPEEFKAADKKERQRIEKLKYYYNTLKINPEKHRKPDAEWRKKKLSDQAAEKEAARHRQHAERIKNDPDRMDHKRLKNKESKARERARKKEERERLAKEKSQMKD
jgi:hypothetical protein